MDTLMHDLTYAARSLRKSPGFTAAAVSILGLGIAASVAVFTLINAYLIRPLPYPAADRVAAVIPSGSRTDFNIPQGLERADWSGLRPVFDAVAAWDLDGFTIVDGDRSDYVDGAWVTSGFFGVVGSRLALGRVFDSTEAATGARVAVISHGFWQRHFAGGRDAIGKTIRAYSTDRPLDPDLFTVIGVLPDDFWHVSRFTNILVPLSAPRVPSLVRLRPGVTLAEATDRLNAVVRPQMPQAQPTWRMSLASLQEEYSLAARPAVLALLGASGVLLLIAAVNVAGLLLVRRARRAREWTMRAALGANRWRLMTGALLEGVLLATVAGFIGVTLAGQTLDLFAPTIQQQLGVGLPGGAAALALDWRIAAFAVSLTALLATALGVRFGLSSSSADLASQLRGAGTGSGGGTGVPGQRRVLVVAQVALSFALLVGAGLMLRTASRINGVSLGFDPGGIIKAHVLLPRAHYPDSASRVAVMAEVESRLAGTAGIRGAALVFPHPFRGDGAGTALQAEAASADSTRAVRHTISPAYLGVMSIELLEGRGFSDEDRAGSAPVALVSASVARQLWPGQSALGRRIKSGAANSPEPWRTIVGVTADVRKTITGELFGDTYEPYAQSPRAYMGVIARAAEVEPALTFVPRAVLQVAADLPLSDVEPLADVVVRAGSRQRFLGQLITGAAGFALVLSLVGLYVVLAAVVAQRRRELAVRMAVGASGREIVGLVMREAAVLTGAGLAVGFLLSLAVGRALQAQLYGVGSADPWSYLVAVVAFGVVSISAALLPAKRAVGVDPMVALRSE